MGRVDGVDGVWREASLTFWGLPGPGKKRDVREAGDGLIGELADVWTKVGGP